MNDMTTLKQNAKPNWDIAMEKIPLNASGAGIFVFKTNSYYRSSIPYQNIPLRFKSVHILPTASLYKNPIILLDTAVWVVQLSVLNSLHNYWRIQFKDL